MTSPGSERIADEDPHEEEATSGLKDSKHHRIPVGQTNLCEHEVAETMGINDYSDVGDDSDTVVIAPRVPSRWQVSCSSQTDDISWLPSWVKL